jgi:hypothetical protein
LGDQNFLVAKSKRKLRSLFENLQLFNQQWFDLPVDLVIEIFVIAKKSFGLYPKKLVHFQLLIEVIKKTLVVISFAKLSA